MINLTRDDARERARLLDVASYRVDLDLTTGEERFASTTEIAFTCREPGASTFVDLCAPAVREATLNGRALDVSGFDGMRLELPELAEHNELRVVADCAYSRTGEGLHRFADPADGRVYLYTQFETPDARRMYTCFDQPDLKSTFEFTVTAPADWVVVSNTAPDVEAEPAGDGVGRWHFPTTQRMSTYITALVAGHYHHVHDEHDGIPLGLYCRQSLAEYLDPDELFDITKRGFDFFHQAFDYRYPFGKYDQLFVPEYNMGAMENAGCVTFVEEYIFRSRVTEGRRQRRAETILHEMAHMWFGDLVTMRWWGDLWLNESFATYASIHAVAAATRWTSAWTTFATETKSWAYREDQLPTTHPISADAPDLVTVMTNFDGITYAKGASVLKQLVAYVGQDEFFEGLRRYFRRHEWGNTTLADLLTALEETSGRDLVAWSKEWLETAGINTLRPAFEVDGDGRFTSFTVAQEAPATFPTLRPHRLAIGLYDRAEGGGFARRHRVELDVVGATTAVPDLVGERRPDLLLLNDDDLAYTKVRFDERSLASLTEHADEIGDSLPRGLVWSTAWDMCRDAELPARDYVRLVLANIGGITDITLVELLLGTLSSAVHVYADPTWHGEGRAMTADALGELARNAPAGSDQQLTFVQAFARFATTPAQLDTVAGLLDGSVVLDDLAVDTDLRWNLLEKLVAAGHAGDDAIEAELARDRTSAGSEKAAMCRAARPTAEAKADAWASVVERDELPNATQRAVLFGFQQPTQVELLEPYVARYFDAVGDLWSTRSGQMAQQLTEMLYPRLIVSDATVEATSRYLEEHQPHPALQRALLEGRDGVERALRGRARDAAAGV
ncbi:MAG: aminopeptidase N [Streptosporangiales bacterium]|nr:aminopeptidase N [Streptosporangiales bacterium]